MVHGITLGEHEGYYCYRLSLEEFGEIIKEIINIPYQESLLIFLVFPQTKSQQLLSRLGDESNNG